MIYPELQNYLTQISSNETVDLFDRSIIIFDKYNVPDYMNIFDSTINSNSSSGADVILDYLQNDLNLLLNHLLVIQGVTLNDTATVSQTIDIVDALFEIPFYSDKSTLEKIIESDESDAVKFCQLMNLITTFSVEEVLSILDDVNENFIDNFKNQIKAVESDLVDTVKIKKHAAAYMRYRELILNNKPSYCDKFFTEAASIGLPYEDYVKQYLLDKKDFLDENDSTFINQISQDLVGLTALSCDGIDNPLPIIRKYLSEIFQDISATTKIDIAVSKIVLLYTQ